jgi:hypothetical protein
MLNVSLSSSIVLSILCVSFAQGNEAEKSGTPSGYVSMILSSASFDPEGSGFQMRCKVTLVNDTGKELVVESGFNGPSVHDAIELVITDKNGITQEQVYYAYHKNPLFNRVKEVTLARGRTESTISFPLSNTESLPSIIKVRLVGVLPGSGYSRIFSTETVEVTLVRPEK